MTFLPIVSRELRAAARRPSTYLTRMFAALTVMGLGAWCLVVTYPAPPREVAQALFWTLTGSACLIASLSGVRCTADCLSEEKREGTLGLLFLTDLKGYDVILGKLTASSLNAVYWVISIIPMLAIPVLLGGGITHGEFARLTAVALNSLFLSLALGMFASSVSRSAHWAMGLTALLLAFFAGVLPLLGALVGFGGKHAVWSVILRLPSPGFAYGMAFDAPYSRWASRFWWSMGVIHALGWIALAAASFIVRRSWRDRAQGPSRGLWQERWHNWSYGDPLERAEFRRSRLAVNPVLWLAARARLKPAAVWTFLILLAGGWVWGLARFRQDWLSPGICVMTALTMNLVLRCWWSMEATRQLAEDRRAGALELLLSTPITVREILRGLRLALQRQFGGPVIVVILTELLFMASMLSQMEIGERGFWFALWTALILMFVADLAALYWVGLLQGLLASNTARATIATLTRILVLPWVGLACLALLLALRSMFQPTQEPSSETLLGLWFWFGIAVDVGFGAWARHRLLTGFRQAAERRFAPRRGFWSGLLESAGFRPRGSDPPALPK